MLARSVLARYLRAKSTKKRMIVMMGPPAAGKGFFLGEPPPSYGWKLPKMLVNDEGQPLLTESDIPKETIQEESDNYLRAIQHEEAYLHYTRLKEDLDEGNEVRFHKDLDDLWYDTKDGNRVELKAIIKRDNFPSDFKSFLENTNKDFYVSMRGWHDDASRINPDTGKTKERFKDRARLVFDDAVKRKSGQVDYDDDTMLIVDSAGEDIDAQDFKGQILSGKAGSYEVTVIFLHPEQADTELSNLARGKVQGKRMVDQADISNWYEKNAQALQDIQAAAPDNFVHYRKGPPDADPAKSAKLRAKAKALMNRLADLSEDEQSDAKKEINQALYGASPYKLHKPTSYGGALSGLPDKPADPNIADTVATMNRDADKRAGSPPKKPPSEPSKSTDEAAPKPRPKSKGQDGDKTRRNFLREMGDRKIRNPNPESRDRFHQIKIRSLPWMYQKPIYESWQQKQATHRIVERYLMAASNEPWLAKWMKELAHELASKLHTEDYDVSADAGEGPVVFVTVKGASEDSSTARKARQAATKLMERSIAKHADGVEGLTPRIRTFNKGADLVLECEVIFP